jgi:hypothetical protein
MPKFEFGTSRITILSANSSAACYVITYISDVTDYSTKRLKTVRTLFRSLK